VKEKIKQKKEKRKKKRKSEKTEGNPSGPALNSAHGPASPNPKGVRPLPPLCRW
jgi:hypothetical protein